MIDDKIMLGVPVSETFDENMKYNLYEDDKKGVYGYLGLYKDKAIRAVGKVLKVVEVTKVGNEYKFSEPVTTEERNNFLIFDKIIQLPFKMPVAQYKVENYVDAMMKKIHGKNETAANVGIFSSLIKTSVGLNPRAIKRLFNNYQLLYKIYDIALYKIDVDNLKQRILFAVVCMQVSFEAVYNYLLEGNLNLATLKSLAEVNDKSVKNFLQQRELSDTDDAENLNNNILNAVFDSKALSEELSETLQKLPAFIEKFISAVSVNNAAELSEKEISYLRKILEHSAIVTGQPDSNDETKKRAIERRQKNRERVQAINKLLEDRHAGKFTIVQNMSSQGGIISTLAAGFCVYVGGDNKKYQLRYVIDYTEHDKIAVSIRLNGYKQDPQEFYDFMGNDPLGYEKILPVTNTSTGWYFYNNVLIADANDDVINPMANEVATAYNKLKEKLGGNLK